jgi:hypothetical protein
MRNPHLLLRVSAVFIACTLASTGVAKEKRKKKSQESHATLITMVTADAISIKEAKAEKTVAITRATEIYVRSQRADIAALQPGMAVNITLAMDPTKASRINATDPRVQRESAERKSKKRK